MLNESFKALVRETFPDKSDKVISIFDEVVSHKASSDSLSVQVKSRAIDEIRSVSLRPKTLCARKLLKCATRLREQR